jgi:gliding motility-associated transport system permease protein
MRATWIVFAREMRSYFVSPVAYTLLLAFLGLAGWYFWFFLSSFVQAAARLTEQAMMFQQLPPVLNVNLSVVRPWFNLTSQLLLFLAPIITMRLLADERGTGRIDLLLSAPVTDLQLVLGKYFAGVALCGIFLLPTLVYPALLYHYGDPEIGPILAGYLGLLLDSMALIAVGLLVSSLTGSQVVAAAGSFGIVILFWVLGLVAGGEGTAWHAALSSVSMLEHFSDFARGVIETRHLVYYLTFTGFMLFLTLRSLQSVRWRG